MITDVIQRGRFGYINLHLTSELTVLESKQLQTMDNQWRLQSNKSEMLTPNNYGRLNSFYTTSKVWDIWDIILQQYHHTLVTVSPYFVVNNHVIWRLKFCRWIGRDAFLGSDKLHNFGKLCKCNNPTFSLLQSHRAGLWVTAATSFALSQPFQGK